jgi:hypothetical protein
MPALICPGALLVGSSFYESGELGLAQDPFGE